MAFDFSTLVTDRTQQDVAYAKQLIDKLVTGTATDAEKAEWNSFTLKGAYNHTDLNRVTAAMEDLKLRLEGYGYAVPGYQRIEVPHGGGSRLPEGYTELAWIESTGTQCIDTGFIPNQNTRVVCDFQLLKTSAWQSVFGAWQYSSGYKNTYVLQANSSNVFVSYYGNANVNFASYSLSVGSRHTVDKNKNVCSIDGNSVTNTATTFTCPCSLYLFGTNRTGTLEDGSSTKIYSCQIYDNGTIVRDYIPCINPSGVVGLYDMVTTTFFGNSGTGSFGCDLDFANQTWQQIIDACKSNAVPSIWKVGDQKTMAINGTDYVIDIIGKTHDTYADGSGLAPLTLQLHDCYNTAYSMGVGSNNGGYSSTIMYKTTLPAIKALMPAEVQAAIVPVSKKTSVGSKGTEIEVISCEMFLLSEIEVYGEVVHSVSGEGNQYDYYKNGGNKIKNLDGNATMWRLRSPAAASVYSYCTVNANASNNYVSAGEACGVSFAFCFGGTSQTRNKSEDENTENKTLLSYEKETELYDPYLWYEFDWPTPENMAVYLMNVTVIRAIIAVMESTPSVPVDMVSLMVQEANDIEAILLDVYRQLNIMTTTFIPCGEALCGGDNL